MTDYKLVPVEQIKHVIYVLERFANDIPLGRYAANELRELFSAAPDRCPHGVRRPHECKECADTVPASEALNWAEREFAAARQSTGELVHGETPVKESLITEQLSTDVSQLVAKVQTLIATGKQLSDEATESQERTFDGGAAEVASIYFWNEFRDALKAATKALEAHCKQQEVRSDYE